MEERSNTSAPVARRTQRFFGALLDYLLIGIAYVIGDWWAESAAGVGESFARLYLCLAPVLVAQAVLVSVWGQSLGKMAARTRIERADGRRIGFVHGVLLRSWLMGSSSSLPLLFLADALWIVGRRRRCLHDLLADTRVVDVGSRRGTE